MTELVFKSEKGTPITNSLLVAEKFGKRHDHVLRDVETLIGGLPKIEDTPLFFKTTYIHEQNGQTYPMYIMNRDGFSLLVMGFTGSKALEFKLEFIEAFNRMEKQIITNGFQIPQTFSEALRLSAELAEKVEAQAKLLEEQKPKVVFTNAVSGSKSSCLIGELAKTIAQNGYPIGQNRLFEWMRENGYLGTRGQMYNVPLQKYIEQGLFEIKKGVRSGNSGVMRMTLTTKVTGKGQVYFVNKFLNPKTA